MFFSGCTDRQVLLIDQNTTILDGNANSLDGGFANSVYLPTQNVDGGNA